MKIFKSSDLSHKRGEVLAAARINPVLIQELRTNGEVVGEFILQKRSPISDFTSACLDHYSKDESLFNPVHKNDCKEKLKPWKDVVNTAKTRYSFENVKSVLNDIEKGGNDE